MDKLSYKFKKDKQLQLRMFAVTLFFISLYIGFGIFLWSIGLQWYYLFPIVVILIFLQYFYSDRLMLKISRAKIVTSDQAPQLHRIVEKVANRAGINKPKIAIINTNLPNAFATGRNPQKSLVAITTGLRRILSNRELEAVIAHEIGHILNKDMRTMAIANFFVVITSFLISWLFISSLFDKRDSGGNNWPVFLAFIVTYIVYFTAQLFVLAISRYREYAADHTGAELTGDPLALAEALKKISQPTPMPHQQGEADLSTASAFCIYPPAFQRSNGIISLFSTHPPLIKRIEKLIKLEQLKKNYISGNNYAYQWNRVASKR